MGGPSPSLNTIWKTLHAVSKVNTMKKNEKGYSKNKCDEKTLLEPPGIFRIFTFLLYHGYSRQNKVSPLETPQNYVTTLGNFKA